MAEPLLALLLAVLEPVLELVLALALERVLWTPRVAQAGVQEVEVRARVEVRVLAEELAEELELRPPRLAALLKAWSKLIAARWEGLRLRFWVRLILARLRQLPPLQHPVLVGGWTSLPELASPPPVAAQREGLAYPTPFYWVLEPLP